MTTKDLSKKGIVGFAVFVISILLLASCELFWRSEPKREEVPLDHIMIPPTKRTDYIGVNITDSVAVFYTFKPYEGLFKELHVDCLFSAQWYNYKGESWFLFRGGMATLHPNCHSFVSIHLQVSPKDWIVHKASVFFYDRLRMDELCIPTVYEELRKKQPEFWTPSLVAREDVNVEIYKNKSSRECVKGVITGSFTQWSTFSVYPSNDAKQLRPPYGDFYPETLSEWYSIYYTPADEPKRFQLSFTAIESLDGYPIIEIASEE